MSKFDRRKIAATLAFASLFSGKSQAMKTKSSQNLAAIGGATIASKNLPVKKGLSKGAKIGIAAAGILTLGTVAALIAWGVKSKGNKGPEDTGSGAGGPYGNKNIENQDIVDSGEDKGKEKGIVKTSDVNKEKKQNIIIENKDGNKPEGNIIMEEKIVEKKQEQSKFFGKLQEAFKYNNFVNEEIYASEFDDPNAPKVKLPWTPAAIFKKMFEAIANKNSGFLKYYCINEEENDEYKKLIDMISGNIEFDGIQVKEIAEVCDLKKYCLTICKEGKEWMKFTISDASSFDDDSTVDIEIQLCELLNTKGEVIKEYDCISIDSLMNEGKFKNIDED